MKQLKQTPFTLLVLELNSLINSEEYNDISIEEVCGCIDRKKIIPSLYERTKGGIDLSIYGKDGPYPYFFDLYYNQMYTLSGGHSGNHRRKWGA